LPGGKHGLLTNGSGRDESVPLAIACGYPGHTVRLATDGDGRQAPRLKSLLAPSSQHHGWWMARNGADAPPVTAEGGLLDPVVAGRAPIETQLSRAKSCSPASVGLA